MKNKMAEKMSERLITDKIKMDTYYIVGAEIRARRYRLEMTLDALADGICSISYLCKVENSRIQPNKAFLAEICNRLELTQKHVDTLLNLRNALNLCVSDFLNKSSENIDLYFGTGKDFDNYRYSIIKMIYYLFHRDLPNANKVYLDLLQISQTMREFDFIIFSLFSAYLHYYNFRFNEAIEILEKLEQFELDDDVKALKCILLLEASYGANKADTPFHFSNAKNIAIDMGPRDLLDEVRYIICLYYIKNDNHYFLAKELNSIRNEKYKNSLLLIKDFKEKNVSTISNYKNDLLTDFALMLKLYIMDYDKFINKLLDYDCEYYIYDFDYNYLDVLASKNKQNYSRYLFKVIIPRICVSDDNFIKHYVLDEVANIPPHNKNRSLLRAYYLMFGYENEVYANECAGEDE